MSATLTVWSFPKADAADAAVRTLEDLSTQGLITIQDAATVSWPEGRRKPRTRQLHHLAGVGALGGAFWGTLFGLLFFMPLIGLVIGAAAGAVGGALTDVGISDKFIGDIRSQVVPGTSALFLLSTAEVPDRIRDAFAGHEPTLVHSNLSEEQEARLREVFSADDDESAAPAARPDPQA